jgi:hypothetical protein
MGVDEDLDFFGLGVGLVWLGHRVTVLFAISIARDCC